MTRVEQINADKNGYLFKIELPARRNINDYTPRVVPLFNSQVKPIEANQILWKK